MRKFTAVLGVIVFFAAARPAAAQQLSTSFSSSLMGGSSVSTSSGNASSFFGSVMTRPDYTAMQTKPTVPTPLNFNIGSFLPTFPNLQNTMLLRNVFGGPQAIVQQAPPPPTMTKKKN